MLATLAKRTLLVLVGPAIFLFVASAPTFCGGKRGFRGWYWRRVSRACSWLLWFLDVTVEISDAAREALRTDENSIIAVNHRSHLDGFSMLHVIPDEKWVTFGAKKELCEAALLKRGFEGAGLLKIDRQKGRDALSSLTDAIKEMPKRRSPILFVEGTRAAKPGLAPFKAGAVLIAQETGRAVRPFVISHSDRLLPRGKVFPFKGTIHIDVLDQMLFASDENTDAAVARLRGAMAAAYDRQTGETTPQ
ncbi:lysophospholipid acyltransferase family protein [Shimia marina]|uniref:1-acyl-sn-glycerol-3-phosphate acyltransferase n=1 Tax=Shimia marina TaxID=321267 RepID=A0A0P1ET01_9RHOB|nr:lysophospholipid acyltransferase family protein [Shimia marina]CUH53505.1 1-acyl-sn-glycerol-3-phosphate acyltransferase [Shimia marina]SFD75503.1 1-acyl-sn-glycerol-3-phosphate acyltransferase [Shimia marina]